KKWNYLEQESSKPLQAIVALALLTKRAGINEEFLKKSENHLNLDSKLYVHQQENTTKTQAVDSIICFLRGKESLCLSKQKPNKKSPAFKGLNSELLQGLSEDEIQFLVESINTE
ncbi:hypothetical protein MJH12_13120, partial [bacterium]|nr:hypothetical protein [bacterium]